MILMKGLYGALHNLDAEFQLLDSEENFQNNLKTQPDNWEYRNIKINYKFNQYGHRCVEPTELQDDYLLFTGCSHTEGAGLALEHRYTDIISKTLNKTYYNLAASGTGVDILVRNILAFLSFNKIPSKVFIQWPDLHRFSTADKNRDYTLYNPSLSGEKLKIWEYFVKHELAFYTNLELRFYILNVLHNFQVPEIYEIFFEHESEDINRYVLNFETTKIYIPFDQYYLDAARDLAHPGIKSHRAFANKILEHIQKK